MSPEEQKKEEKPASNETPAPAEEKATHEPEKKDDGTAPKYSKSEPDMLDFAGSLTEIKECLNLLGKRFSANSMTALRAMFNAMLHCPASTRFHSNFDGGLIIHSVNVSRYLRLYTEQNKLTWDEKSMVDDGKGGKISTSPIIIGLCHDFCKIYAYELYQRNCANGVGPNGKTLWVKKEAYNFNPKPEGVIAPHGSDSTELLLLKVLAPNGDSLTEEEAACINYHMGPGDPSCGGNDTFCNAAKAFPNVMFTYLADMMASRRELVVSYN